jgi:hypothetical protein
VQFAVQHAMPVSGFLFHSLKFCSSCLPVAVVARNLSNFIHLTLTVTFHLLSVNNANGEWRMANLIAILLWIKIKSYSHSISDSGMGIDIRFQLTIDLRVAVAVPWADNVLTFCSTLH